MTIRNLNTWMIFKVIIASLVLMALIFPKVASAESTSNVDSVETTDAGCFASGQNSDFGSSDSADVTSPQGPQDFNETTSNETPFENSPENDDQNSGSDNPDAPEIDSPEEGETDPSCSGNSYVATITPDAVAVPGEGGSNPIPAGYGGLTGGDVGSFTITFTEVGDKTIGSARVTIPGTFTNLLFNPSSIVAPAGKNWSGGLVGQVLSMWALDSASYLDSGESVSASVIATTPTAVGQHKFVTSAWTDANASFNGIGSTVNNRANGYSDPVVIVGLSVSTADELNAVRANLDGHFVQTGDINLSGYTNWEPIGTNSNYFNGSYNGNGFKISNLTINRPAEDFIGLFGRAGSVGYDAVLSNIHLENVNVTGYDRVGGLVGYSEGTISNSYATGDVGGRYYVGGLVGLNDQGTIADSYATGSVKGTSDHVGGLVGSNGGTVTNCYATGSVTGNDNVGGLVGLNNRGTITYGYATGAVFGNDNVGGLVGNHYIGTVTNCYATGAVTGYSDVGGLVGLFNGTVTNCYAAGAVTGTVNVGGLVGYHYGGTVTDSFWDTTTSGQSASAGGTGKTTAEMKQLATFGAWDISAQGGESTVWRIYETSTYPLLRHFFADRATITVSAASRDYDGTTDLTGGSYQLEDGKYSSWIREETVSYQASSKNAGSVEVILLGVYSNQREYDLVFDTDDSVTINPLPITVTAVSDARIYDGTTNSTGVPTITPGALVDDDTVTWTQAFDNKNVGTGKTITPAGTVSDGNGGNNYNVNFVNDETGVITLLSITVTAVSDTRVYDGTTNSTGVPTITPGAMVDGDSATWTQTFGDKNVGKGKTLTPAGTVNDGNSGNNYAVTFDPVLTGEITVKTITITPDSGQSKIIGDVDPVFTYQHTALFGNDQLAGALSRVGGEDLGNYAYTLGNLSASSNYNLLMTASPAIFAIVAQPEVPDPDPDPDDPNLGDPITGDQGFAFVIPSSLTGAGLTNIPGQAANAVITPAFVTGGSAADLGRAIAAYNQAKQSFEANKGSMSAAEKAVAEVELATANAAIVALELALAFQNGQAVDVAALIAAYQAAQAVLNNNRGLLSAEQIAAAEALLNAISSVIGRLST